MGQRPVSVVDTIQMRRLGVASYMDDDPPGEIAQFSPHGRRFALVLKQGNVARNANDYTLMIYNTRAALTSQKPETTVTLSSTSNREGIKAVKWLANGHTLLFLGETPHTLPQIYSFDVDTRHLKRLTHHPTAVVAYDASDDGRIIVFEAEPPTSNVVDNSQTRRTGFVVDRQNLNEILLAGTRGAMSFTSRRLYLMTEHGTTQRIPFEDGVWPILTLSVSPNGRYALIEAFVRHVPPGWLAYKDKLIHEFAAADKAPSALSLVETYVLLDTKSGTIASLLGAPKSWEHDGFLWLHGGKSLVLSRSFLPLSGVDTEERGARESRPFVVEVNLPSRQFVKVGKDAFAATVWQPDTNSVVLKGRGEDGSDTTMVYRKNGNLWKKETQARGVAKAANPRVTYEEDMNTPPRIWISDPATGVQTMLLDLNPQFAQLCLAEEKTIYWKATDGHDMEGGLYLPPGYKQGKRLPLVIQTHAFDPKRFWMDGPWSSAFAARPLAAKGIAVLQIGSARNNGDRPYRSTPQEAPRQMAAFEGAIASLDKKGIVDPDRVGIIGFSRTVYHVAYTLTHSRFHFAAATLADGFDGGYFQALAFPTTTADFDAVNGGPPFGGTLTSWLEHAPAFQIAGIDTPVRLEDYSIGGVLQQWEWYSLLSQMKKPVDFLLLPEGTHILVKPLQRIASQQGNVDWFAFWLKGEEDPAKPSQYKRWRHLRELQATELEGTFSNRRLP